MSKQTGEVQAKSWQHPAVQTASKGISARPFPEIAKKEEEKLASLDSSGTKDIKPGAAIDNINRAIASANSPVPTPTMGLGGVQAKLTLGTPGDKFEQEADRVARQVVDEIHSSPFPAQNSRSEGESQPNGGQGFRVQRQITVRAAGDAGGEISSEWEGDLLRAKSGGVPMSPMVKEPMERAFGADFSGVRVHTGQQADQLARSIQAKAFTTGQDVFFRQGAYQPGSRGGQELIAHELTHVVQQNNKKEQKFPQPQSKLPQQIRTKKASPIAAVQCYYVLTPDHVFDSEPPKRPWFGYPYAVAKGENLVAQEYGMHDFLKPDNKDEANTKIAAKGFSLRVSQDYQMAVEDSNLTNRQPKVFFATPKVVEASNKALEKVRSNFRLQSKGRGKVKVLIGWYKDETLDEVTPLYKGGSADKAPQNCNEIAANVVGKLGMSMATEAGSAVETIYNDYGDKQLRKEIDELEGVVFETQEEYDEIKTKIAKLRDRIVESYALRRNEKDDRRNKRNEYAEPRVGEAYVINTVGEGRGENRNEVYDFAEGKMKKLDWAYHFGGVVARSGGDTITLENYARGDGREARPDPRWYFQMYGMEKQSYHTLNAASGTFANPLTVVVPQVVPQKEDQ